MRCMLEISLACLINQLSPSKPLEVNLSNGFFCLKFGNQKIGTVPRIANTAKCL